MNKVEMNLPEDLIIEILSRLSVKALMRLKCVKKSWYTLVKNPTFISEHFKNHKDDDIHLFCLLNHYEQQFAIFHDEALIDPSFWDLNPSIPPITHDAILRCVGSFHGLFLLINRLHKERMVIWNPATREYKLLPQLEKPPPGFSFEFCGMDFERDPFSNDCKFVLMCTKIHEEDRWVHIYPYVFIYTSNITTNYWRVSKVDGLDKHVDFCEQVFWNGGCYWLTSNPGIIVSFHMNEELFRETNAPVVSRRRGDCYLDVYDNSLSVINMEIDGTCGDIWVMLETGWIKKFTFRHIPKGLCPLALWRNCLFFEDYWENHLCVYDLITEEFRNLKFRSHHSQLFSYKESLVPIKLDDD